MKIKKRLAAAGLAALMTLSCSSLTAFAKDVNSVGSDANDYKVTGQETAASNTAGIAGYDDTQDKESVYQTVAVEEGTVPCDVYATQAAGTDVYDPDNPAADEDGFVDGSVELLLPKVTILDGVSGTGKYVVAARGNINGTSYIKAEPTASFTMRSIGKADITASISQPVQHFSIATAVVPSADNLAKTVTLSFADTIAVGTITAPLTAGQWHGTPTFTIGLVDTAA